MAAANWRRRSRWAGCAVAGLLLLGATAWYAWLWELKQHVIAAMGPAGSAQQIETGFDTITLTGVRLRAPDSDWPTTDTFRAERVTLSFDVDALLHRQIHIRTVEVQNFYIALVRTPEKRLALLPNLKQAKPAGQPARDKLIDQVSMQQGELEFVDESVRKPAYHIKINNAQAQISNLQPPGFTEAFNLDVTGSIKGAGRVGKVALKGWINKSTRDSQTHTTLQNVDIAQLDPYLLKKTGAQPDLENGSIDLTLDATVKADQIQAPGVFTLRDLKRSKEPGLHPIKALLALPAKAEIAALKDDKGEITLKFEVSGNLHQPKFALAENLPEKVVTSLPKTIAQGAGKVVKKTADTLLDLLPP